MDIRAVSCLLMSSALLYGKQLFMAIHICIILRCMSYGHKGIMLTVYKYEIKKKRKK